MDEDREKIRVNITRHLQKQTNETPEDVCKIVKNQLTKFLKELHQNLKYKVYDQEDTEMIKKRDRDVTQKQETGIQLQGERQIKRAKKCFGSRDIRYYGVNKKERVVQTTHHDLCPEESMEIREEVMQTTSHEISSDNFCLSCHRIQSPCLSFHSHPS